MDLSREPSGRVIDLIRAPIAMRMLKKSLGEFGPQTALEAAGDDGMAANELQYAIQRDPLRNAIGLARAQRAVSNAAVPNPTIDDSGQVVQRANKEDMVDDSGQVVNAEDKSDALEVATNQVDPTAAPAEDPRTSVKNSSFFDKPGATDALVAFGASMLKGDNFNDGLADAAIAVNQVEQRHRMPSEGEVARARMGSGYRARSEIEKASERAIIAEQMGLDPNSDEYQQFVLTGTMPKENQMRVTATDKKAIFEAENDLAELNNTESVLNRALEINEQTYTGLLAGPRGTLVTKMGLDDPAAKATVEWERTMSGEAIKVMADSLKGATTDYELREFQRQLADPSTPVSIRKTIIERMLSLAQLKRQIVQDRMDQIRNQTYYGEEGGQTGRRAAPQQEAPKQSAPKANPKGSVQERANSYLTD